MVAVPGLSGSTHPLRSNMPLDLDQIGKGGPGGLLQAYIPSPNRTVAFIGPYIALASGFLATWSSQHLQIIGRHPPAAELSRLGTFLAGTAVSWALLHKWLQGWQLMEADQRSAVYERLPDPIPPSPDLPPPDRTPDARTGDAIEEEMPKASDSQ